MNNKFKPDFTPNKLRELGVLGNKGIIPMFASQKSWPSKWVNKQDPGGWGQWYLRYHAGRRTDDDARQIRRWASFKARHLAQFTKNPTPRRAYALINWGIDPYKYVTNKTKFNTIMKHYRDKQLSKNPKLKNT